MEKHRKTGRFPGEVRERTVRLVHESEGSHPSRWVALVSVSGKIGCTAETLRRWVREAEIDSGVRAGVTTDTAARVKELEREMRELRQANEILRRHGIFRPGGARPPVAEVIAFMDDHIAESMGSSRCAGRA
jgi:transposase-like protein